MRSRNIKPGFFKNEELAEVSIAGRLLFIGLWCLADKAGRLEDRPKRIGAEVFPYEEIDVDALLGQLAVKGFIQRYEAGDRYIQIHNFIAHQKPHHREQASVIPPPGSLPQLAIPMAIVRPTPADTEPLPDAVPIPDFIDKDLWRKYLEWSRNERGWTVSIVEQEMQLALLKSIHDEGLDANESIRKTISGRYKTFFPPNTGKKITNLSSPDERGQSQEYVVKPSPLPDGMTCGECYKFGQQCEPDGKRDGTETECRWTPSFFARRAA